MASCWLSFRIQQDPSWRGPSPAFPLPQFLPRSIRSHYLSAEHPVMPKGVGEVLLLAWGTGGVVGGGRAGATFPTFISLNFSVCLSGLFGWSGFGAIGSEQLGAAAKGQQPAQLSCPSVPGRKPSTSTAMCKVGVYPHPRVLPSAEPS